MSAVSWTIGAASTAAGPLAGRTDVETLIAAATAQLQAPITNETNLTCASLAVGATETTSLTAGAIETASLTADAIETTSLTADSAAIAALDVTNVMQTNDAPVNLRGMLHTRAGMTINILNVVELEAGATRLFTPQSNGCALVLVVNGEDATVVLLGMSLFTCTTTYIHNLGPVACMLSGTGIIGTELPAGAMATVVWMHSRYFVTAVTT